MKIDALLQFADNQTLAADAVSENVVNFKDARDIGVGEDLYIVVVAKTALTGTLQVNIETDDAEAFPSATVSADIGSMPAAAPIGTTIKYRVSPDVLNEQYARLDFNGVTAGDVSAFIVKDIDAYTSYPVGYTIS